MRDIVFRTIMLKGASGNDITSIEKTGTSGVVDTYTITLSDGSTETFTVTNGSSIASIEKTSTSGLIDTYTVTLTDGSTTTFEVANGANAQVYEIPADSVIGFDSNASAPAGYEEISSPFDAALDSTSDNAPQTKAVKAELDLKAPLASPSFTGSPTAPTASAGHSGTRIATTAFVQNAKNTGFTNPAQYSAVNVTSRTTPFTDLGSFTLAKGTWLVIATINFAANDNGYRAGIISSSSGASSGNYNTTVICGAAPSDVTRIQITAVLQVSAETTHYIEAKQNSGSTLSCAARVMYIKLSD